MAHKVLNLLWNLAHSDDVPVDIMDQALSAHIKILDYSCSQVSNLVFSIVKSVTDSFLPCPMKNSRDLVIEQKCSLSLICVIQPTSRYF